MEFAKSVAVAIAVVRDSLIAVRRGGMRSGCWCGIDAVMVEYRYLVEEDWNAKKVCRKSIGGVLEGRLASEAGGRCRQGMPTFLGRRSCA